MSLRFNQITDISVLAGLTNLEELWLTGNQITDISPLAGLTNLTGLGLSFNQITDWSPVAHIENVDGRPDDWDKKTPTAYEQYVADNNVTLDNYDVQYDISGSVGKSFFFNEYAAVDLSDYYNYNYRDTESTFFCLSVTPAAGEKRGSYSDMWYVYADRTDFAKLLEGLKEYKKSGQTVAMKVIAEIDPDYYDSKQKMATLVFADADIDGTGLIYTWG